MAKQETPKLPAVVQNPDLTVPDAYLPGTAWAVATETAHTVAGHDLAKDELLDALVGVPFLITALTFREGVKSRDGISRAYVSCEAVIADEPTLKRRRVNMADLPFEPNDMIVFNDGSTGIHRQIVSYLDAIGYIDVPTDLAEAGEYGTCRYDLPPAEWSAIHAGQLTGPDEHGFVGYETTCRLTCPRGLRLSDYTNDYNPAGSRTRYLG